MKITEPRGRRLALALALVVPAAAGSAADARAQEEGREPPPEETQEVTPEEMQEVTASELVGSWLGTLEAMGQSLRIVFRFAQAEDGTLTATLDSPDQGATGIAVSEVTVEGRSLALSVADVAGRFEGTVSTDGEKIEGEWQQGGLTIPLLLERTETEAEPAPRPQNPEPPYPYLAEEVSYPNPDAGITLAGTLTLPEGEGPHPAVVLVSGSGPQDRDESVFGHRPFLVLADHLTRRGIAVLRYDDRGVGGSTGDFSDATSEDFASDALAGVAFLKGRAEIDAGRIGLVGHSEGGLIAPMAAASSADVAFIVMIAGPGLTGEEILYRQAALISRASGVPEPAIEQNRRVQEEMFAILRTVEDDAAAADSLRAYLRATVESLSEEQRAALGMTGDVAQLIERQVRQLASPWFRYFLTHDPAPVLRRVRVPVLAINGELDLQVPAEANLEAIERALAAGGNPDYTVRMLAGLNHLLQPATTGSPTEYAGIEQTISPDALALIADWILERFGTG